MRGIKSPVGSGRGRRLRLAITIAFPLAKNMLHGGHSIPNGILEPPRATDGLALPAITP